MCSLLMFAGFGDLVDGRDRTMGGEMHWMHSSRHVRLLMFGRLGDGTIGIDDRERRSAGGRRGSRYVVKRHTMRRTGGGR